MSKKDMNQNPNTQTGYPQSEVPYFPTEHGEPAKSKTWKVAIISIVAVLIVALATTLIIVLKNKGQLGTQETQGVQNIGGGTVGPIPPPPPVKIISISENGSTINGQPTDIDFFIKEGKAYLNLEDIASVAGYDFEREGDKVKLLSSMELATLEVDSINVTLQDISSKATTSVEILKAPLDKDGKFYIYSRDLSVFMKNTNVSYNSTMRTVEIKIDTGMGGPGGPMGGPGGPMGGPGGPMGGQPHMGGQMPPAASVQPAAPAQSAEPAQQENSEKEPEVQAEDKQPSQPAPDGQPPMDGPAGPPPKN